MKKLFALVLAVVMICAMSTSVFAVHENVVGTRPEAGDGDYEDGIVSTQDFPAAGQYNMDITASVGSVEHRYAVDIEYDELTFNINGTNLVWNVNTLQYEAKGTPGAPAKNTYAVKVINYSDLAVNLTVAVTDTNDADFAVVTSDFADTIKLEDAVGVELAAVKTSDTAKSFTISINPAGGKTWADVANYYTNYFADNPGETEATMGTMTITVAKVPTP